MPVSVEARHCAWVWETLSRRTQNPMTYRDFIVLPFVLVSKRVGGGWAIEPADFRNRRATALKVLVDEGQGFWLCHKRLSSVRSARSIDAKTGLPSRRIDLALSASFCYALPAMSHRSHRPIQPVVFAGCRKDHDTDEREEPPFG